MVKSPPPSAEDAGSIPGWGPRILHSVVCEQIIKTGKYTETKGQAQRGAIRRPEILADARAVPRDDGSLGLSHWTVRTRVGPAEDPGPCCRPPSLPGPLPARPQQSWLPARLSLSGALARLWCPPYKPRRQARPSSLPRKPPPRAACGSREEAVHRRAGTRAVGGQGSCKARRGVPPRVLIPIYTHRLIAWDVSGLNNGILLKYQFHQVRIIYK